MPLWPVMMLHMPLDMYLMGIETRGMNYWNTHDKTSLRLGCVSSVTLPCIPNGGGYLFVGVCIFSLFMQINHTSGWAPLLLPGGECVTWSRTIIVIGTFCQYAFHACQPIVMRHTVLLYRGRKRLFSERSPNGRALVFGTSCWWFNSTFFTQ